MTKNSSRPCRNERAVSPVVGVMLMLVVVIIIAAIVSGFAGGLVGGGSAKKAPTLAMDVKVVNTGDWRGSGFFATVTGVSEPIPTKDLRIVTSWTEKSTNADNSINAVYHESTTVPNGSSNINVLFSRDTSLSGGYYAAPFGSGPGVNGTESLGSNARSYSLPRQQFGNYTLIQGTTLSAKPAGARDAASVGSSGTSGNFGGYGTSNASYQYSVPGSTYNDYVYVIKAEYGGGTVDCGTDLDGYTAASCWQALVDSGEDSLVDHVDTVPVSNPPTVQWTNPVNSVKYQYTLCSDDCIDPAKAVLGADWNYMRWGNTVNVKVIHIPTGKVIFQQDVPVTE